MRPHFHRPPALRWRAALALWLGILCALTLPASAEEPNPTLWQLRRGGSFPDLDEGAGTPPPGGFEPWDLGACQRQALTRNPQVILKDLERMEAVVNARAVKGRLQPQVGFQLQAVRQTPLIDEFDIDTSGLTDFILAGIPTGQIPGQPTPAPQPSDQPGPPPPGPSVPVPSPNLGLDDLGVFPANIITVGFKLQQTLYASGKIRETLRLATLKAELKGEELEGLRQETAYVVGQLYLGILLGEESLALLEEMTGELTLILEDTQRLEAQGFVTRADVLEAKSGLYQVLSQTEKVRADIQNARSGLRLFVGAHPEDPLTLEGDLQTYERAELPEVAYLEEEAIHRRSDLGQRRLQAELARENVKLERSDLAFRPQAGLNVEAGMRGLEFPFIQTNWTHEWGPYYQVGLGVQFGLYSGGTQGAQVAVAEIQRFRADVGVLETQKYIQSEVLRAHGDVLAKEAALEYARVSLEAKAEKARVAQERFAAGDLGRAETLGATLTFYQARSNLALALYNVRLSYLDLHKAVGTLPRSADELASGGAP